jgi:ActD protein
VYLIGEFQEKATVIDAIRMLKAAGIEPACMDLFSEEPVELPRGVLDRPTRMSLAGVSGAILFGVAATAFIWWAQHNYRLPTGGMPVFSFWATGVITYEMTMLGAIVSIFGWFLRESGLLRKRDKLAPVPTLDPGSMCLRVRCDGDVVSQANDAMRRAGAVDVQRRSGS